MILTFNPAKRISALLLFFFLIWNGCGYTQKVKLPNDIKTIAIPTFENKIPPNESFAYRPGLEIEITSAVRDRFIFDGNLKVVEETNADAVLRGAVISYEQEGVRFDSFEDVEEYRLYLVVAFELTDRRTGEIIMKEPNFSGQTEFFTARSPAAVRRSAANSVVTDLARAIVDRIVEEW